MENNNYIICIGPLNSSIAIISSKNKRISSKERQDIVLSPFLKECLVGHLLGDGFITKSPGRNTNARFGFSQSGKKIEYFTKVFSNFKVLCTPDTIPHVKLFTTGDTNLSSLNFWTIRLPCLNAYYELFYGNGKRIVPINIIDILSPIGLSYWIIDDGSKQNKGIHLNVYSFDEQSIERLLDTLRTKYSLVCTVHYHKAHAGVRIYIYEESIPFLRAMISRHIVPSIYYKVGM